MEFSDIVIAIITCAVACPRTNGFVGSPHVGTYSISGRIASATVWWMHTGSGTVSVDFIAKHAGMIANS